MYQKCVTLVSTVVILVSLTFVALAAPSNGANTSRNEPTFAGGPGGPPQYHPERILVKPKHGVPLNSLANMHKANGASVIRQFRAIGNLQVVRIPRGQSVQQVIAKYKSSGLVEYAEPDYACYVAAMPNDPMFCDLWAMRNVGQKGGTAGVDIQAFQAWNLIHDAPDVVVAVIDTGVGYNHPDLAANMWVNPGETAGNGLDDDGNGYVDDVYGINAITGSGNPMDDNSHGTHCAGTIGAVGNNGIGVAGVAWQVKIMALKFLGAGGGGYTSQAVDCIDYAREKGAHIMSNSWSGSAPQNSLRDAIAAARDAGIIFVAAASNYGTNNDIEPYYPASYDLDGFGQPLNNIVSVAATDRNDQLASFSNWGPTSVDLAAPGVSIRSTVYSPYISAYAYDTYSGTSMATPHVAGAFALLKQRYPTEGYAQLVARLLDATDPIPALQGKCVSEGRLNLYRAIAGAGAEPCEGLLVTPSSTASWSGVHGGPFSSSQSYTLTNATDQDIHWLATADVDWLALSDSSGILSPNGNAQVTVSVNSAANGLAPGVYSGVVTFVDETNGCSVARTVSLNVRPHMEITEVYGLKSGGPVGGPFSPSSKGYVVKNIGPSAIAFTISKNQPWVSLSSTGPALGPNASITITVSINSNAEALSAGLYSDVITFTNTTNGSGNTTRPVDLAVGPIYVKPTGNDANSGLSWSQAKRTVVAGVLTANVIGRTEVWVATGTYNEQISLKPGVAVYGGFAGNETQRSQRNWNTNITTLTYWGSPVVAGYDVTGARVDGFTISGGDYNPGVRCWGGSSFTIANNRITGNDSQATAGAIYCDGASPVIINNLITGNSCEISGCGGIRFDGACSPTVINNTIVDNYSAMGQGGGIDCGASSAPTIANNIIAYNRAGIRAQPGSNVVLASNDVFGNANGDYSGLTPDAGSISADPKFVDRANGNYHLLTTSPCIEKGSGSYVQSGWLDIDGQARVQRAQVDIGADEWSGAAIIHVTPTGNDANNGFSWDHAKQTVQAGVDAALAGEEVWVKAGTYTENITMKNGVALCGGFAGTEASSFQRDWVANVTTLDGDQSGSVIFVTSASDTRTRVDGFTIRNGSGRPLSGGVPDMLFGGGIFCDASAVTIRNNTITSNNVNAAGAGVFCTYEPCPTIALNTITGNSAGDGGAIGWDTCHPTVTANTISGNSATGSGGALHMATSTGVITNNTFSGNSAETGGAIYCFQASPSIVNNTLSGNSATNGGGIHCTFNSQPTIANNIIAFGSSGILADGGMNPSNPTLRNNDVYGNTGYNYSGVNPGTGDISADPRMVANEFRLMAPSPCIDAGSSTDAPGLDKDGYPRPADGDGNGSAIFDIGAFEYRPGGFDYPDGTEFIFGPVPVTASLPAPGTCSDYWVYVERPDRAAGLRVYCTTSYNVGQQISVRGTLQTDDYTGERYIQPYSGWPQLASGTLAIGSVGMRNQWLGGAATGSTPVIKDGFGFYNVGLLVQSWGSITAVDPSGTFFYIDDGSNMRETATSPLGVRVVLTNGVTAPAVGSFAKVTGISSALSVSGNYVRVLRPRTQNDIQVVSFWALTTPTLTPGQINYITLPGIPQNPEPEMVFTACNGCPQIDLDGPLTRYDAPTQAWMTHWYGPDPDFRNCLLGDGFGLEIPSSGANCYYYMSSPATGDQVIGLPRGSADGTVFSLVGNPFGSAVACSSCKVTDGNTVRSLTSAMDAGWILRLEYWTGTAWQQYTGTTLEPRVAYKVFPKFGNLALIVPAP